MSNLPMWERQKAKQLTLTLIKDIVGHVPSDGDESIHFILKLRCPNKEKQDYDLVDYLVKPWDVSANTLKSSLFKAYFKRHCVTEWRQLLSQQEYECGTHSVSQLQRQRHIDHVVDEPTNRATAAHAHAHVPAPSASISRSTTNTHIKMDVVDEILLENSQSHTSPSPLTPTPDIDIQQHQSQQHCNLLDVPCLSQEQIEQCKPMEMVQKLGFIHGVLCENVSGMSVEQLLRNCRFLNYVTNQCAKHQFDVHQKMEHDKKKSYELSYEFETASNTAYACNQEIAKFELEIKRLCMALHEHRQKLSALNDKLVANIKQNQVLKESVSGNKQTLVALQNEAQKTCTYAKQMQARIEETYATSDWSDENIIEWILCMSGGYFAQHQYHAFIQNVKKSKLLHHTFQTQVSDLLLRAWGLNQSADIAMFMNNYQRLMSIKVKNEHNIMHFNEYIL